MSGELADGVDVPVGRLRFALHPQPLVRGTGLDVTPLFALGQPGHPYEAALDAALRAVRAAFRSARLREAVSLSNPAYHDLAFAPGAALVTDVPYAALDKRGRRQVRTAHRYLRRLLARTETTSFFGPTLVAEWDPAAAEPVSPGEPAPERCAIGLSHWVVVELARRLRRALPAAGRAWSRDPLWRRDGDLLRSPLHAHAVELDAAAGQVWEALADPATVAEVQERVARAGQRPEATVAGLTRLAPALRAWPEPPATEIDGLAWLSRRHPGDPLVARLAALLEEVVAASWPRSLEVRQRIRAEIAAAGLAVARGAGQHYADRDVVNEDRSSPWSGGLRLGADAVRGARTGLRLVLPLLLLAALLRQADAREAVARAVRQAGVDGLVELAARPIDPVTIRQAELRRRLDALVPDAPGLEEVRLDADDLAARLAPLWGLARPLPDDVLACLPGLDLMVAGGPPGRGLWVLSECHDDSSSAIGGITSRARPNGGRDFERLCGCLDSWIDTSRMATIVGRRRSRHVTPELPGLSIELSGVSRKPRHQVVPAVEVCVSEDGARVVHRGRRYQLYPGDLDSTLFVAASLPCLVPVRFAAGRPAVPRVVLGDVVLQRRTWRPDLPELGRGARAWRAGREWRDAQGLPAAVFVRHPDEPKPLYVDLDDPLSVDDLSRLRPARVVCTEVLPDLRDTWWREPGPQPAELRVPVLLGVDR